MKHLFQVISLGGRLEPAYSTDRFLELSDAEAVEWMAWNHRFTLVKVNQNNREIKLKFA